VKNMLV